MNEAEAYFAAELAELQRVAAIASQLAADQRAADRAKQKREAEARARRELRRKFTVEVDGDDGYHSICLLDVPVADMRAAIDSGHCDDDGEPFLATEAMQKARSLYLCGRKADAMDELYPAVRDALGVAV